MKAFYNGSILPKEKIAVSPDDRGFVFADGAYEVIRSYKGRWFRMQDHCQRLAYSLKELKIYGFDVDQLPAIADQLLAENNLKNRDALLYLQVTRGVAPRNHFFPDPPVPLTVYGSITPVEPSLTQLVNGIPIITVPDIRWLRCDIKSVSLLPNILSIQKAREAGAEDALFIRDSFITETTRSSFFAVIEGQLRTHPLNHFILPSITRKVILELCQDLPVTYEETRIHIEEKEKMSEAFICGTGNDILPVVKIDNQIVGTGKPGAITIKLQNALKELATS